MTEPLAWDDTMQLARGNDCKVDTGDNPRTPYLINDACVLAGREPKTAAMTDGVSGRGGGHHLMRPVLDLSDFLGGGGGVLLMPIPQAQPYENEKRICCYR